MKNRSLFIIIGLSTTLLACGEAERANGHLESLNKYAERMANAIEGLLKLGVDTVQIINTNFKPKAPAKTEDIDDILSMDSTSTNANDDSNKKTVTEEKKVEAK